MIKKGMKNRKNRRMKKAVRRTFGALFMTSAIIIAAIPFPDAAAVGEEGIVIQADEEINYDYSYINPSQDKFETIKYVNDLEFPAEEDQKIAYTVREGGGGWQIDWHFRYFIPTVGSGDGIIIRYNDQYATPEVNLSQNVYSDYFTVSSVLLNGYYSSEDAAFAFDDPTGGERGFSAPGGNLPVVVNNNQDVDSWFFEKYFPGEYKEYLDAYAKYIKDPEKNEKPADLSKIPNINLDANQKLEYFCDVFLGKNEGFVLRKVDERLYDAAGDPAGWNTVYIPCDTDDYKESPILMAEYKVDANGFLCGTFDKINGIGKEAFKDVGNVTKLTLANEIQYIGDSAFENSGFLQKITLTAGAQIGNRAFKNCKVLTTVDLPEGNITIGCEAFYGSAIENVVIPYSTTRIGYGAFAECSNLKSVTCQPGMSAGRTMGDYAFFNCIGLNEVNFGDSTVTQLGKACFAVDKSGKGTLSNFIFPADVQTGEDLGEFVLAGRTNLKTIEMPKNFGYNSPTTIPDTAFYGCTTLDSLEFPDDGGGSCGMAKYNNTLFATVINPNFYVRGPKVQRDGNSVAEPRRSTWAAYYMNDTDCHVPYVYTENGQDFYEVSNGDYVLVIDKDGVLNSCTFAGTPVEIDLLSIPSKVGITPVTGIKEGCFGEEILDKIKNLVIEESSITSIDDNVFREAEVLETVKLGNSIKTIGKNAFAECPALKEVVIGSGIESIGEAAFKDSSNLVDITFESPKAGVENFKMDNIGKEAFSTGGDKLTIHGDISPEYGPFKWAMQPDNYMNEATSVRVLYQTLAPTKMYVILDNQNNLPTLISYPHYEDLDPAIRDAYENNGKLTADQEKAVKATMNIVIPEGVKSIDTVGYFNNSSKQVAGVEPFSNASCIDAYFGGLKNRAQYSLHGLFAGFYGNEVGEDPREYPVGDPLEVEDKGNDRITAVTMSTVEYLPDGCFYSCENLATVNIGSALTDIGALPFENCTSLTSIAGNEHFMSENGILYENLPTGGKRMVECFASRGLKVGSSSVNLNNDPLLAEVTEISPAAFRNCTWITNADFTGAEKFTAIPDACFDNCTKLVEVDLPYNVTMIGKRAFANTGEYTKVIVRGKEVSLGANAFENVTQPFLVSYKNSSVRIAAREQGVDVSETLDDLYTVKFYSHDGKILIATVLVEEGGTAEPPSEDKIPVVEGMKFVGWNQSLKNITQDMIVLAVYEPDTSNGGDNGGGNGGGDNGGDNGGTGGNNGGNNGGSNSGNNGGGNGGDNNGGTGGGNNDANTTKYNLEVVYGTGSGSYPAGTTVIISAIEPPAGKVFDKWVSSNAGVTITSATSAATTVKTTNSDARITATYKNVGSSGSGSTVSSNVIIHKPNLNSGNSGTIVDISKLGISNIDKAYASVNGSTDNFIVKISENSQAADAVATALAKYYGDMTRIKYFAMDISLYDATGTTKIENTNRLAVNITMPIPDALVQYAGNNKVAAVANGSLEPLNCKFTTVDGIPCVSFTATHFSPYTIYVDTGNLSYGVLDSTPKTGDGIHPKWFVVIAFACISMVLFLKKDKVTPKSTRVA